MATPIKIAINGFGRIGRNFLRAFFEGPSANDVIQIVAINDIGTLESLAHLLKYDSTHGMFCKEVSVGEKDSSLDISTGINVDGQFIPVFAYENPSDCPWQALQVDLVIESSGCFRSKSQAAQHLSAGAKKVLIAAVAFDEVDRTVVYGVNESNLCAEDKIISAASCTTHCIAPVLKLIDDQYAIENIIMTEIHAYTNDQQILDHAHRDLRRARAGALNLIPTTSSSISAVQKILPQLQDKIMGYSMRVPVNNVAVVDLTINLQNEISVADVNGLMQQKADGKILGYSELPLVSSDFNHRSESAIFDASQTKAIGKSIKMLIWYDNEWAYANRLLDLVGNDCWQ